jgi:hypothetical protein
LVFEIGHFGVSGVQPKDLWVQSQQLRPSYQDTKIPTNLERLISINLSRNRNVLQIETVKPELRICFVIFSETFWIADCFGVVSPKILSSVYDKIDFERKTLSPI